MRFRPAEPGLEVGKLAVRHVARGKADDPILRLVGDRILVAVPHAFPRLWPVAMRGKRGKRLADVLLDRRLGNPQLRCDFTLRASLEPIALEDAPRGGRQPPDRGDQIA